jgi:N-acetylglutamate synthase-like GNAT family acetyltransferase
MAVIRPYYPADAKQVDFIMQSATCELRTIYVLNPIANVYSCDHSKSVTKIVAIDNFGTVIGVAEFIVRSSDIYAQGIAVAAPHRQRGVATALLANIAELSINLALPHIQVTTIKETGNVEIFKHMGFTVIEERISARFIGQDEKPVTEVTLQRMVFRYSF